MKKFDSCYDSKLRVCVLPGGVVTCDNDVFLLDPQRFVLETWIFQHLHLSVEAVDVEVDDRSQMTLRCCACHTGFKRYENVRGRPDFLTNLPDTFFWNPWSMYELP